MAPSRGFPFTTAVRVIDRVHGDAAVVRPLPHPALATGFAEAYVFVFDITDLTDSRGALDGYASDFARWQLQHREVAFFRNKLRLRSRRTRHLAAFAGFEFNIVYDGTGRNVLERKRIANKNIGGRP